MIVSEMGQRVGEIVVKLVDDGVAPPRVALHVDDDIEPHAGAKRQTSALGLVRLARLSVDCHDRRLVPLEAQRHHARQRAIDEPQAQPLAGFHRLVADRAAVERHDIANMARHRIVQGVAETPAELAVGIQTPVREHPDEVAIDRDGFPFLDDERAGEATSELLKAIGVRVVPKRAGVGRGEPVGKACAGLDRLGQTGHAVHGVGQADAVPMNRGVLIEGIGYKDTCRRTLPNAQDRPRCMAIIGPT